MSESRALPAPSSPPGAVSRTTGARRMERAGRRLLSQKLKRFWVGRALGGRPSGLGRPRQCSLGWVGGCGIGLERKHWVNWEGDGRGSLDAWTSVGSVDDCETRGLEM